MAWLRRNADIVFPALGYWTAMIATGYLLRIWEWGL